MRAVSTIRRSRPFAFFQGPTGHWTRLATCFINVTLSTAFITFFLTGSHNESNKLIWLTNGVQLAYLLLAPRWRWPSYLAVGFAGQLLGSIVIHGHFQSHSLIIILLNLCEVLVAALLLRRNSKDLPQFTNQRYLIRFFLFAVLLAPFGTGLLFTLYYSLLLGIQPISFYLIGSTGDAMGIAVATPAMIALFVADWNNSNWRRDWIYPFVLVAVTIASFVQASVPTVFFIYPLLLLVLLRMSMGWATLSLLFVSISSSILTYRGMGPFAALTAASTTDPGLLQQLFIATGMIILYSVSVVLDRQKKTEARLQEIVELHHLVTENNRDLIILADLDGRRRYVSPASESMVGWTSQEQMSMLGVELVHPLDQGKIEKSLEELRSRGGECRNELRVLRKDETYLWVESFLRALPDPQTGKLRGILNIVRDISQNKIAEQQLQEAYNAVEALAVTDALTGLANRRRFDQYITSEWRRSMREHQPLSLLMLDADFFKAYNDTYGHTRGDSCLKQIAEAAQDVISRPGDMVARFGGEEFAVILPNTENNGAMLVAQEICDSMARRGLVHSGNPYGVMTISVGCATMVPHLGQHAVNLIELADRALYEAKHNGRNCVWNGNELEPEQVSSFS